MYSGISFSEWVLRALDAADRDPYVLDNHLRQQHEFLSPGIDIFRYEDGIESIIATITKKFALPYCERLPHLRRGADEIVPVTAKAMKRLKQFYAADFSKLQYDDDIDRFVSETKTVVWSNQRGGFGSSLKYIRRSGVDIVQDCVTRLSRIGAHGGH